MTRSWLQVVGPFLDYASGYHLHPWFQAFKKTTASWPKATNRNIFPATKLNLRNLMPNYRDIYNHIVSTDHRYQLGENSPGLRAVIQATGQLQMLSGRSLDIGCGVGFVVEHLSGRSFDFNAFGVDISDNAIEQSKVRLKNVPGSNQRLSVLKDQTLPFEDDFFSLVTCFDVLEHLDETDIEATLKEIDRVIRPGGVFFGSVSCRTSGVNDQFGDNLHRTVKSPDWWIKRVAPDRAEYDGHRIQLSLWKHHTLVGKQPSAQAPTQATVQTSRTQGQSTQNTTTGTGGSAIPVSHLQAAPAMAHSSSSSSQSTSPDKNTASLYQKIYDENPWYGDADEGRCPGVRLLPEYRDWLVGPILDMGCGRGQTVEHLRKQGLQAEGIDQIRKNPEMRVGDITKPIADIGNFNSVVCIDCIEHLYEDQVLGLFENMKQVQRQAFSIHNGESTGTGQELHVNRRSFQDWAILIRKHFDIAAAIEVHKEQMLYLTQSKQEE